MLRGTIVATGEEDDAEGEIFFTAPLRSGTELLDFDPRGQSIQVLGDGEVVLQVLFPADSN